LAVVITPVLTEINDCEANTNWSIGDANPDLVRENANSIGIKVSQAVSNFDYTGSPLPIDLSKGEHVYMWLNCTTTGLLATKAAGGIGVRVRTQGGATNEWYLFGSDNYFGGWKRVAIDPGSIPSVGTAFTSAQLAVIDLIGARFNVTGMISGNFTNVGVDIIHTGFGLRTTTTGGSVATLQDIVDESESTAANKAYGIVEKVGGVVFCKGQLTFGDESAATCEFLDSNQSLVFEDLEFVNASHYLLKVEGNGTGTTSFQLGQKIGTGDTARGSSPVTVTSAGALTYELDISGTDIDTVKLYGSRFQGIREGFLGREDKALGGTGDTVEVIDTTFSDFEKLHRNIGAASTQLLNNTASFGSLGDWGIKLFDALEHDESELSLISTYGLASNQQSNTSQNYTNTQGRIDIQVSGADFTGGQTWDVVNPTWSGTAPGTPLLDWGPTASGVVSELFDYDVTMVDSTGTGLPSGVVFVHEDTDDDFAVEEESASDGVIDATILKRLWVDGAAGASPTQTEGPFTERALLFGRTPIEQTLTVSAPIEKDLVMLDDAGVTLNPAEADAITNVLVSGVLANPVSIVDFDAGTIVPTPGEFVTGQNSGATGFLEEATGDSSTGELILTYRNSIAYQNDEPLDGSTSGAGAWTADIASGSKEFSWLVGCGGNTMAETYAVLGRKLSTSPPEPVFSGVLKDRVTLLDRSGDDFSTSAVDSLGVICLQRGSGNITALAADDDRTFVPPLSVTLELNNVVVGSRCTIIDSNNNILMNEEAVSTTVTESYTYQGDVSVTVRVRKSSAVTKYLPFSTSGTVTSNGLTLTVNQTEDTIAS
jgi:hypothetical protein